MTTTVERNVGNDNETEAQQNPKRVSLGPADGSSWGQFQFAKRLSLVTPRYDVPGSDDEGEDMFTMYNWSNCAAGTDQFTRDGSGKTEHTSALSSDDSGDEARRRRGGGRVMRRSSHTGATSSQRLVQNNNAISDNEGGVSTRRRRFFTGRSDSSQASSDQLSDDDNISDDGSRDGAGCTKRGGRKNEHTRSYPAPTEGYHHQEPPSRPPGRAQRRSSMGSMPTSSLAAPAPEAQVEEPRRSSGRIKRRGSMPMFYNTATEPEAPLRSEPVMARKSRRRRSKDFEPVDVPDHPRQRAKRRSSMPMSCSYDEPVAPAPVAYDEPARSRRSSRKLSGGGHSSDDMGPDDSRSSRRSSGRKLSGGHSSRKLSGTHSSDDMGYDDSRSSRRSSSSRKLSGGHGSLASDQSYPAEPPPRRARRRTSMPMAYNPQQEHIDTPTPARGSLLQNFGQQEAPPPTRKRAARRTSMPMTYNPPQEHMDTPTPARGSLMQNSTNYGYESEAPRSSRGGQRRSSGENRMATHHEPRNEDLYPESTENYQQPPPRRSGRMSRRSSM